MSFPSTEMRQISADDVVCEFSSGINLGSIVIDTRNAVIHFANCHVPRGFLTSTQPEFSAPVGDIKAVYQFRRGTRESMTIVTGTGKAHVPSSARNYPQLREFLQTAVPANQPGYSIDHPVMGYVYLGGILVGAFAAIFVSPINSAIGTTGLYMLGGGVVGFLASHGLVAFFDRCLGIGLAQPIGYAVAGFVTGLMIGSPMTQYFNWNLSPVAITVLLGTLGGFLYGISKQARGE